MKIILKETVEHYHIVDIDDYDVEAFAGAVSRLNPQRGIESVNDLINELQRLYKVDCAVRENAAGKETISMEVVDEYDE